MIASNTHSANGKSIARARRLGFRATVALVALTMLAPVGPTVQVAQAAGKSASAGYGNQKTIKLGLNKSFVLELGSDAYDILVANPAVADAVTRTARRIYLFGKTVGQTNVIVFGPNGEQIGSYDIEVERDVAGLEGYLERFIPGSDIKVELLNDNVVLTGTVNNPLDAARAAQLATIFVSGGEATTGQYSQTAAAASDGGGVDINNPDNGRRNSQIINLLKIVGEDQVTLKVTVAEVSRSVMKQLGVNIIGQSNGFQFGRLSNGSFQGSAGSGLPTGLLGTDSLFDAGRGLGLGSALQGTLNAMEQTGAMKTLAEPTLTAISGEQAQFRVGGEFNVLANVTSDNGVVTRSLEKIDYGIGLEFLPTVLSPGRISLKVRTSVSEPTTQGAQDLQGESILSLRKRLADTTVELPSGGSMMIAGLVQDEMRQQTVATPGLSKIPVLGALFRSREYARNETELVIIVTPYLSKPVARAELSRPDDNFANASDGAGFFLGRVNRVYGTAKTNLPNGRYHGVVGYIYK